MNPSSVMKLHVLGCSGPYPESGGATSGYLLEAGDSLLQFDFGCGVLGALTARTAPESLTALLISHWHFDHTSDLLPLIYRLQAAQTVLPLYAPADDASVLRGIAEDSGVFDLHTVSPGDRFDLGDATVTVGEARHPVPGVCFRVELDGRCFGYTGDTNTLPSLPSFFRGCDFLLADGLFPRAAWSPEKPHLSAELAAELARDAGVRRLVITHLNPSFPPQTLLEEARRVFPAVQLASRGAVFEV